MNRVDRMVSDETELGREKEYTRKALQVTDYSDRMLAESQMSDQLDPGQEEEEDVKERKDEEKEVEQRVPATSKAPEGPWVPVAKKKYMYPVLLLYFRGISEQLRRVLRSFDIPACILQANQHTPATTGTAQG